MIAAVALFGLSLPAENVTAPRTAKTHTVTVENMVFRPATLTVAVGDTVVWVNKDVVPHTATTERKGFDSGIIGAGASWRLTMREKGDWSYLCTLHPAMKATVRVK
jgi:plastocyanin